MFKVVVFIPAYNEEESIREAIDIVMDYYKNSQEKNYNQLP